MQNTSENQGPVVPVEDKTSTTSPKGGAASVKKKKPKSKKRKASPSVKVDTVVSYNPNTCEFSRILEVINPGIGKTTKVEFSKSINIPNSLRPVVSKVVKIAKELSNPSHKEDSVLKSIDSLESMLSSAVTSVVNDVLTTPGFPEEKRQEIKDKILNELGISIDSGDDESTKS